MSASDFELKCITDEGWQCPFEGRAQQRGCSWQTPNHAFTCRKWTREPDNVVFYDDFAVYVLGAEKNKHIIQICYEKEDVHLTAKILVHKLFLDLMPSNPLLIEFHRQWSEVYKEEIMPRLNALILKLQQKFPTLGEEAREEAEEEEEESIDPIVRQQTEELLISPSLLHDIKTRLDRQGYIGEDDHKVLTYCAPATKDILDKNKRLALMFEGESGVGKTQLLNIIERYFPKKDIKSWHRVTEHAPEYLGKKMETLDGKILIIKDTDVNPGQNIRIMIDPISGGLNLLTTTKKDGALQAEEIKLQGVPFFSSATTQVKIDPQTLRRVLEIFPREDPGLTRRIMEHKARMREDMEYKKQVETDDPILKAIPRLIDVKGDVVIPFASKIGVLLPESVLLMRSDIDKIFNVIELVARTHKKNRIVYTESDKEYIVASPSDFYYAWQLISYSLTKRIEKFGRASKVYEACKEIMEEKREELRNRMQTATTTDIEIKMLDLLRKLREKGYDYSRNTLYPYLNILVDKGYLDKQEDSSDRRANIYKLTNIPYSEIAITFPNEEIKNAYYEFLRNKNIAEEQIDRTLRAIDIFTGEDVTFERLLTLEFQEP